MADDKCEGDLLSQTSKLLWGDDGNLPAGAILCLQKQIARIKSFIISQRSIPRKTALRVEVTQIEQTAKTLARLLTPVNIHYLIEAGEKDGASLAELGCALAELAKSASEVLDRIPDGRDTPKFILPRPRDTVETTLGAEDYAALVGAGFWEHVRGQWPGLHNEQAFQLMTNLWTLAGGTANPTRGWRQQVEHVRPYREMILREIRGQINALELEGGAS